MKPRWLLVLPVLCIPLTVTAAAAGGDAQTIQPTSLNAAPYSDAASTAQLPVNTPVTLVERRGGWYHVRLGNGRQGWLRMTSVRLGEGSQAPGSQAGGLSALGELFQSGRSSTTTASATTGVRGLNEGSIRNARPDVPAVQGLAQFAATPDAARRYAAQLKLKSTQVAYLPANAGSDK